MPRPKKCCRDMVVWLSDYIDNELDEAMCMAIKSHARTCPQCHTFLETLQRTVDLCKHLEKQPLPESLAVKIEAAIQASHLNTLG